MNSGASRGDRIVLAADHQAEAALEAEDAAARPDVDVVDPALGELACPPDVVVVPGVAAVDHGVSRLEQRGELGDGALGDRSRGDHDPDGARRLQDGDELCRGRRAGHPLRTEAGDDVGVDVRPGAPMAVPHRATHEVRAHAPEPDHPQLQRRVRRHRSLRVRASRVTRVYETAAPAPAARA